MNQKESRPSLLKNYCVILSSIIVILAGVYSARSILGPFLLASFFAVLLVMPMNWLTSKGVCQWLALTVISIGVLLVGGGAATIVGSQIAQFASDIPEYRHRFITTLEENNLHIGDAIPFFKEDTEPEPELEQSPSKGAESTRQENSNQKSSVKSEEVRNLKEGRTRLGVEQSSWETPIDQENAEEIVLGPYFEKALDDYRRCEQSDGVSVMSRYRIGMAQYLMGEYAAAISAFSDALAIAPQSDDMYIAALYWLVLSQLRAGKPDEAQKTLQQQYRPGMYVGHHTAYEKAMRAAADCAQTAHILTELGDEPDDLQFAMTAYGLCVLLETHGEIEKADALREKLLARDGFWFCFSYLAAYSDYNYTVKPATVT